jgi:hypothetical protein
MKELNRYTTGDSRLNIFFYEPWLLKELAVKQHRPFVPKLSFNESLDAYHIYVQMRELRREACCVEVVFPYLYIRILQQEHREKLFGFIYLHFSVQKRLKMVDRFSKVSDGSRG